MGDNKHGELLDLAESIQPLPRGDVQVTGELFGAFLLYDNAAGYFHESWLALHGLSNLYLWVLHVGGAKTRSHFLVLDSFLHTRSHHSQLRRLTSALAGDPSVR